MKMITQVLAAAAVIVGVERAAADEWRQWPGDPRLGIQFQVLIPDDPLVVAWRLPVWSTGGPIWHSLDIVQIDCEIRQWRFVRGQVSRGGAGIKSLSDREKWEAFATQSNSDTGKLMRGLCSGEIPIPPDTPN